MHMYTMGSCKYMPASEAGIDHSSIKEWGSLALIARNGL